MRNRTGSILALGLALALAQGSAATAAGERDGSRTASGSPFRIARSPSTASLLPSWLEPNQGQARPEVEAIGRSARVLALLSGGAVAFRDAGGGDAVRMRLEGASPGCGWEMDRPLPGRSHSWRGRGPGRTGVPRYAEAVLRGAWPGIDVAFRSEGAGIAYGFRIRAGADGTLLRFAFDGAESLGVDRGGSLVVGTTHGEFRHSPPLAWQESAGRRRPVSARFETAGTGSARIVLGRRDPGLPTFVDPRVDFCSYLGGGRDESVDDVGLSASVIGAGHLLAADAAGGLYIAGATASTDFPVAGTFPSRTKGDSDIFVAKVDAVSHDLLWTAFLGSSATDLAEAVTVDGEGRAVVAGNSLGSDFPVTDGAFMGGNGGTLDTVLFRLSADGSSLDFSTFFGGSSGDTATAVACAPDGTIVFAGSTWSGSAGSTAIPLKDPLKSSNQGLQDAFLARMSADGRTLLWSTYWGGGKNEYANDLALDDSGNLYVVGSTWSTNFPVEGTPLQAGNAGGADAFLARFAADGKSCTFSSCIGGAADDGAAGVAVGGNGAVHLVGSTRSSGFPLRNPLRSTIGGTMDAFVAKLVPSGSEYTFAWSTLLGAEGEDKAFGVALVPGGKILVSGETWSSTFPATAGALQATPGGGRDGFLVRYLADGSAMEYATYLGGNGSDALRGLAVSGISDACVGGATASTNLPRTDAFQSSTAGGADAWIEVVSWVPLSPSLLAATPVSSSRVDLSWTDRSGDETSFEVQRRKKGLPFLDIADLPPNSFSYEDVSTLGSTDYEYRVRTVNAEGPSAWSNLAPASTPPGLPGAPLAPGKTVATAASPTQVVVQWADRSDSEDFFQVNRRPEGGTYATVATPGPGSTSLTDTGLLPDRTYSYRVRAGNIGGLSPASNEASVTMPATLGFVPAKGNVKDSEKAGKDQLKIAGTLSLLDGALGAGLDPGACRFELCLGGRAGTRILWIPAGDEGWRQRKGTWTWKSPAGSLTKAAVKLDPATGTFSAALSRMSLPSPMENPCTLSFGAGDDGGTLDVPWTVRKPGLWKFP